MYPHKTLSFLLTIAFMAASSQCFAKPYAYFTNFSKSNTVTRYDEATGKTLAFKSAPDDSGFGPWGITTNKSGSVLYVTHTRKRMVAVLNANTRQVITTIPVGGGPEGIAITPDNKKLYVANQDDSTVSVISTATNTVTKTLPGFIGPLGVVVSPSGKRAYVTNNYTQGSSVAVIDTANDTLIKTIAVGINPVGIVINTAGTRLYVANYNSNSVSVIDTASNAVIKSIIVGKGANGLAIHPSGKFVYVGNQIDKNVVVINTQNNTKTATIKDPVLRPYGLATNPAGTRLYVSNCCCGYTGSLIDTRTNKLVGNIDAGDTPIAFGQFVK